MRSKYVKNIFLLMAFVFVSVYLANILLIARSSELLVPYGWILDILLDYSGIVLFGGYFSALVLILPLAYSYRFSNYAKYLLRAIVSLQFIVLALWLYLTYLEKTNYSNYVFSTYAIYLPSLNIFANFQTIMLIEIYFIFWFIQNRGREFFSDLVVPVMVVVLFASTFLGSASKIAEIVANERKVIGKFVSSGGQVEDKPDFESLNTRANFIVKHTESESTIIHPKQSVSYPVLGNQPLIRHYLYPRTLVSTTFANDYLSDNDAKAIYYLLAKSEDNDEEYFPKETSEVDKVYILLLDGSVKEFTGDNFAFGLSENYENLNIGIIKIK